MEELRKKLQIAEIEGALEEAKAKVNCITPGASEEKMLGHVIKANVQLENQVREALLDTGSQ